MWKNGCSCFIGKISSCRHCLQLWTHGKNIYYSPIAFQVYLRVSYLWWESNVLQCDLISDFYNIISIDSAVIYVAMVNENDVHIYTIIKYHIVWINLYIIKPYRYSCIYSYIYITKRAYGQQLKCLSRVQKYVNRNSRCILSENIISQIYSV